MKKKLVVLLAVVMMFAFSASAYAASFSDVSERPIVEQDAIKKAVALGIIEGYEDGTFGPDKTITRAEFAKIAVNAAGARETATMLEANSSAFKDVRANSWYTGWINAAESLGIFKGDTNGNFRPNDTISNQEAITVMLRLLGYNDNLTGSWPVNYVTKANQIGLLDDVSIVASGAAKRGDIVVMLGNALDTAIVTYDKDTNEFVYKQTTKSGSSYITLLDDSFDGKFLTVERFDKIDQVRDVAAKTLNWSVGDVVTEKTISSSTNNNIVYETGAYNKTLIVDEDTAVSYNAEGLFDLENHKGKVYFITINGKEYARFIDVESYVQKVSDKPVKNGSNKVSVVSTNYNAITDTEFTDTVGYGRKNTSYYMYFNDDDQVYRVVSDRDFTEKAYYVKALTTASARLIGTKTKTVNMNDADTLIYADGKFVSPSDLEVGDALMEIVESELYVKVADQSGDYTRTNYGTLGSTGLATTDANYDKNYPNKVYQHKATIGGKTYVFAESTDNSKNPAEDNTGVAEEKETAGVLTLNPNFYDEELEPAGVTSEDVYNNNVTFLLNKDNSISVIKVDETSTGSTLYGVVVDGGGNSSSWAKGMSSITLFTQEGYTVTYDFDKNCITGPKDPKYTNTALGFTDHPYTDIEMATEFMGQPVAYKLNTNGEIKFMALFDKEDVLSKENAAGVANEVKVKNNAYLVDIKNVEHSLASNVVIFEVDVDDKSGELDVSLVTRSAILSGGNFTPERLTGVNMGRFNTGIINPNGIVEAYARFDLNSNKAIKAMAYTRSSGGSYYYGIVKSWMFTDANHVGITNQKGDQDDYAITLVGDDTVYDLLNPYKNANDLSKGQMAGAGQLIIYKLHGNDAIEILIGYKDENGLSGYAQQVIGYNDGLIVIDQANAWGKVNDDATVNPSVFKDKREDNNPPTNPDPKDGVYRVMTDANTVVFVIDAKSGDYREGSLDDISRNAMVFVPVIDDEGFAECVIVDEFRGATPGKTPTGNGSTNGNANVLYILQSLNSDRTLESTNPLNDLSVTANVTKDTVEGVECFVINVKVVAGDTYLNHGVTVRWTDTNGIRGESEAIIEGVDYTIPVADVKAGTTPTVVVTVTQK